MTACGDCKFLTTNPKTGYNCMTIRCGASKMAPTADASQCKEFQPK